MLLALAAWSLQVTAATPTTRSVSVTATDEKGAAVRGLSPEEVVVLENGIPRAVTRLDLDRRPLTLAVVVDSSAPMSSLYRLNLVGDVVEFLNRLPEGWRAVLWTTGDRPTRVAETMDPHEASSALKRVFPTGGNTLLDTLVDASQDLRRKEGERTVVVVVTGSGIGFANRERRQVVEKAQGGGTLFMAVQFDEEGSGEIRGDGIDQVGRNDYDYVLESLTRRTGGFHERSLSAMGVGRALQKIAAALQAQYRLTYVSDDGETASPKIEVQVARPGVKVRVGHPFSSP